MVIYPNYGASAAVQVAECVNCLVAIFKEITNLNYEICKNSKTVNLLT